MPKSQNKKKFTRNTRHDENEDDEVSLASNNIEDNKALTDEGDQVGDASLDLILRELREFRRDNGVQLQGIQEDINKTNKRVEEAEERIQEAEAKLQANEETVAEMLKLHIGMDAKLTDLEGRSRRENVRIHGVKEGTEEDTPSMVVFVENLLKLKLEQSDSFELRVERAHRAFVPKPAPNAPGGQSIVAKLASYRTKEEILKY